MTPQKAIVIGAGIAGLATARTLAGKGYEVTVIERSVAASGASVRNFGMIWPIGQPAGQMLDLAMKSREVWIETAKKGNLWYDNCGSLHIAYNDDEWIVLSELYDIFRKEGRMVELLDATAILSRFNGINPKNLIGGLFSASEVIVEPRSAIQMIAQYLQEQWPVTFLNNKAVTAVETGRVFCGDEYFDADIIVICSGADFETLYPAVFSEASITKCKLQMMRFVHTQADYQIGTSVCGGLSLTHYESFTVAPSLNKLKTRYALEMPQYPENGIHVMVSQNNFGELTVGDSHHYGLYHDPFDAAGINQLILQYLEEFMITADWQLVQSWHGIYPKLTNKEPFLFMSPKAGIYIFNGLGGAGMTLSFGVAEKCINSIH